MLRLSIAIIAVLCMNTTCRDVVIVNLGKTEKASVPKKQKTEGVWR